MKVDSLKFSRKATTALLLCTGLVANQPLDLWAESGSTDAVQIVQQQKITVKGTVNDALGPVIGASVVEKGNTGNGTITDMDGKFSLSVKPGAVLVVSYIGYQTQEVTATAGKAINVTLKEDTEILDEVVVVGYGTMKKKDLTGAISQINPEKIADTNPTTVQELLKAVPGLQVSYDASAKGGGTMQLRGQNSVYDGGGHNNPLLVVDGMIFYGELSEINPDDIQQIDVLKDASSTAVYGARAASGVIIITTKKVNRVSRLYL